MSSLVHRNVDAVFRRLRLVLIAFAVALAATLPAGARAMTVLTLTTGAAIQPACTAWANRTPASPCHHGMAACVATTCIGVAAVLPAPAPLPDRVLQPATYAMPLQLRWISVLPPPNPFPPRPVARV